MKKLFFLFALIGFCLTTTYSSAQEYSADSTYTTFTPQVSAGASYFSKPIAVPQAYMITVSAYVTADTLTGGASLWVSTDGSRWKQWKSTETFPYSAVQTTDTIAFANATSSTTYIKHWVFPMSYFNYYRIRYYSGASGTGGNNATNLVTIRSRYTLKKP